MLLVGIGVAVLGADDLDSVRMPILGLFTHEPGLDFLLEPFHFEFVS